MGPWDVISAGWDPGMFSINRLYGSAILPDGNDYTFWGRGVSQGHSDAIRRISGVLDARQYTVPVEDAMNRVRSGENPVLSTRDKHLRECYVVAADGADQAEIRRQIVTMPGYFADYDTTVTFITMDEMRAQHSCASFLLIFVTRFTKTTHRVLFARSPVMTTSIILQVLRP